MRYGVIASVLLAIGSTSAAAQRSFADGAFGLGVGMAVVNDPPTWFTNAICPDEHPTGYQIAGGVQLRGPIFLKAAASRYSDNPDLCINGLVPPIPQIGPYTARGSQAEADITGYPFWTLDVQLGVQTYLGDALLGRAGLGTVWIPSKSIVGFAGTIGTGLRIPRTPLVATLTFEQQWLTVPYVDIIVEYMDGQIEDVQVTARSDDVSPSVWTLGLELWW